MCDRGQFSWCTSTLNDMPVEAHGGVLPSDDTFMNSLLDIDEWGAAWGIWALRCIEKSDMDKNSINPYSDDVLATLKVQLALADWRRCMLLPPSKIERDPRALLVAPLAILKDGLTVKCRYIGTVTVVESENPSWIERNVQLGGQDNGQRPLRSEDTYSHLMENSEPAKFNDVDEMVIEDVGEEPAITEMSCIPNNLGEWLNRDTEDPSQWLSKPENVVDTHPQDVRPKALIKALRANNRSATRFLIKRGILIDPEEVGQKMDTRDLKPEDKDEKLVRGLMLLGDVYAENKLLDRAINTYQLILEGPWAQD